MVRSAMMRMLARWEILVRIIFVVEVLLIPTAVRNVVMESSRLENNAMAKHAVEHVVHLHPSTHSVVYPLGFVIVKSVAPASLQNVLRMYFSVAQSVAQYQTHAMSLRSAMEQDQGALRIRLRRIPSSAAPPPVPVMWQRDAQGSPLSVPKKDSTSWVRARPPSFPFPYYLCNRNHSWFRL